MSVSELAKKRQEELADVSNEHSTPQGPIQVRSGALQMCNVVVIAQCCTS